MKNWISSRKPSLNSDHSLKSLMNYSFFNICHQVFSLTYKYIKYKIFWRRRKITPKTFQQTMLASLLICQMIIPVDLTLFTTWPNVKEPPCQYPANPPWWSKVFPKLRLVKNLEFVWLIESLCNCCILLPGKKSWKVHDSFGTITV